MRKKDYRFETDVLTLIKRGEPHPMYWDWQARPYSACNDACWEGIAKAGWLMPPRAGSKITLVFTTKPTRGASTCDAADLHYAGMHALRKHAPSLHRSNIKLYWWPMIVTGGK